MTRLLLALLALSALRCSHAPEVAAPTKEEKSWDSQFEEGRKHLESQAFDKGLATFQTLASKYPNAPKYFELLLATGESLARLGRWDEALETYHQAARLASQKDDTRGEAEALYQLALCAEALGDDLREVSILRDLLKKKNSMPEERGSVEVPARLAAAYARMGVEIPAQQFFRQADRELARLERLRVTNKLPPEWLVKLLFNMGALSLRPMTADNYLASLKPLPRAQGYLLRAATLQNSTWSKRSADELIRTYKKAWELIQSVPLSDESDAVIARKNQYETQKEMAEPLFDILDNADKFRTASEEPLSPEAREVLRVAGEIKAQVDELLHSVPPHKKMTPEASAREGLRREGRPEGTSKPKTPLELPKKKKETPEDANHH